MALPYDAHDVCFLEFLFNTLLTDILTRGSAIAEEPRNALRQLK